MKDDVSPHPVYFEQLSANMNTIKLGFKKALKIAVFVLLGMAILGYFVSKEKKEGIDQKTQSKEPNQNDQTISKIRPVINPVDVYGNFEKKGFSLDKQITSEGSTFTNKLIDKGIEYTVETYCENGVDNVTSITLSANRILPQYNKVEDMKSFLKFGCTFPYDGSDLKKIKAFIEDNYYKNKASINISGINFTIYTPTQFARMIEIEKN